jgi:hypothetical protein
MARAVSGEFHWNGMGNGILDHQLFLMQRMLLLLLKL